jgi:HD-GYP domain-containing protein (c-di-GMP phosphodiesterase class II)/ABC-type Mn2+/Zn2+ transport system permease subunit
VEVISSPFFQRALAAGLLAAVACGIAGTYVVIKEMASISGGLAHAAFGGLGLGYALGFSPMLGAAGFSLLSGLGVGLAHRRLHQGLDTLIMMMWSVGMALGILLVAAVPGYAPDLASFLFGNLLFVTPTYVMLAGALDLVLLLAVVLLHRQLQAVAVDEEYAEVMGLPVDGLVLLLMGLVSLVVVLLIRVVGVLLVVALLTIPGAVARHWARTLGRMMVLATAVAVVIGEAGRRLRNTEIMTLALAFISLGGFFMLHGLSTPGFILPFTRLPSIAAQLSHTFLAFWLCVATLSPSFAVSDWLRIRPAWLVPGWSAIVLAAVVAGLSRPQWLEAVAVDRAPLQWAAMIATLALLGVAGWRFLKLYRFTRLPLQKSMLYAVGWIVVSQVIVVFGELWHLSWWTYHVLLLAALVLLGVGLWQQYASGAIRASLQALFAHDPAERIRVGLSPAVRALVVATEAKDRDTAEHNERVANLAVRIGDELGLRPEWSRALAQGGMVHDVGKLEIPDAVLNKPGRLTDEEFAMVKKHPVVGWEMARRLGMMREELEVIRHHHERWDGHGYPDGLAAEEIPLLARILAVADVYDALTSDRSYRAAWSVEQVDAYLREHAGSAFDPQCVAAWLRCSGRQVWAGPSREVSPPSRVDTQSR